MSEPRLHARCGQPMTASRFDHRNPTPNYRSQPIWSCHGCRMWEPREGWDGPLPAEWDGQAWTGGEVDG